MGAPRRQRNVSGLFISTFDKYRQLSLEYAEVEVERKGEDETEDERERERERERAKKPERASVIARSVRGAARERRGGRWKRPRESSEKGTGGANGPLICDFQYTKSNPSFSFARGPRRLCRLNAINDLIPVITVLIYRAHEGPIFLACKSLDGRKVSLHFASNNRESSQLDR